MFCAQFQNAKIGVSMRWVHFASSTQKVAIIGEKSSPFLAAFGEWYDLSQSHMRDTEVSIWDDHFVAPPSKMDALSRQSQSAALGTT
jgi:hypothetical protein